MEEREPTRPTGPTLRSGMGREAHRRAQTCAVRSDGRLARDLVNAEKKAPMSMMATLGALHRGGDDEL